MRNDFRTDCVRRMCRGFLAFLLGCLLLAVRGSPAAEDNPGEVRFADAFATDSRKDYEVEGEVAWRKGALILGSKAVIARRLPLGFTAEVRATVGWSADERDRNVALVLAGDDKSVGGVALKRSGGKVTLVGPGRPSLEVSLGEAGTLGWEVRLEVRYGLVHARAWRRGEEEPTEWQVVRQAADVAFQPAMVRALSRTGGTSLEGWQVRGVASWRPEAEAARDLARALELNEKAGGRFGAGKYAEARLLLEEALAIRRKALPPHHPDLATSLNNLGLLLQKIDKHTEARPLYEEALAIYRKALPPLHPDLATSINNLGALLRDMGKHAEALPLYEEALRICHQVFPPLHPQRAASLNNLGLLLWEMGRTEEAFVRLEESVTAWSGHTTLTAAATAQRDHLHVLARIIH